MMNIAIFSLEADLHAHAVLHALRQRGGIRAHFIATDAQTTSGGLTWTNGSPASPARIRAYEDTWVDVAGLDVVWWRRVNQPQAHHLDIDDPMARALIDNEWKTAIAGIMYDAFSGTWVNYPAHDVTAGNKLYQLTAATRQGFRIPRTLVSSDPEEVLAFCESVGGEVIAKKLMGAPPLPLASVLLTYHQLAETRDAISLCPAIYQEYIHGHRHIRAHCFGDVHATLIESTILDWRRDLSSPFRPISLGHEIEKRLKKTISDLGLAMGVMDLIITEKDEIVWLELNTQGQFLFCEALSGFDLTNPFADFLITLGVKASTGRKNPDPSKGLVRSSFSAAPD